MTVITKKSIQKRFYFVFTFILVNAIINHVKARPEPQLGHITETDNEWILELNFGHPISTSTSVNINNNHVQIMGGYSKNGVWHDINEEYTIPERYTTVSTSNNNGKIRIVAKNCKGDCPWDQPNWPFPPNFKFPWEGHKNWPFND